MQAQQNPLQGTYYPHCKLHARWNKPVVTIPLEIVTFMPNNVWDSEVDGESDGQSKASLVQSKGPRMRLALTRYCHFPKQLGGQGAKGDVQEIVLQHLCVLRVFMYV